MLLMLAGDKNLKNDVMLFAINNGFTEVDATDSDIEARWKKLCDAIQSSEPYICSVCPIEGAAMYIEEGMKQQEATLIDMTILGEIMNKAPFSIVNASLITSEDTIFNRFLKYTNSFYCSLTGDDSENGLDGIFDFIRSQKVANNDTGTN